MPLGTGDSAAFVYRRIDESRPDRRAVLPDRRTQDEGPPPLKPERRVQVRRLEQAPKPLTADQLLGRVRSALAAGLYAEAAQLAAEASIAGPLRAEAFYLRGRALVDGGRDDEALVDLRKAVYLDPRMGFAHFLLAGVLDRLGHPAAAAAEYGAAADTWAVSRATPPRRSSAGVACESWLSCAGCSSVASKLVQALASRRRRSDEIQVW